jgi:hypothetical protein
MRVSLAQPRGHRDRKSNCSLVASRWQKPFCEDVAAPLAYYSRRSLRGLILLKQRSCVSGEDHERLATEPIDAV